MTCGFKVFSKKGRIGVILAEEAGRYYTMIKGLDTTNHGSNNSEAYDLYLDLDRSDYGLRSFKTNDAYEVLATFTTPEEALDFADKMSAGKSGKDILGDRILKKHLTDAKVGQVADLVDFAEESANNVDLLINSLETLKDKLSGQANTVRASVNSGNRKVMDAEIEKLTAMNKFVTSEFPLDKLLDIASLYATQKEYNVKEDFKGIIPAKKAGSKNSVTINKEVKQPKAKAPKAKGETPVA